MSCLPLSFKLPDALSTQQLGARLGAVLRPGDTILLHGDLGVGKTTLARGLIEALCDVEDVPSPTYTLIQTYDTTAGDWLIHADLYRIEDANELEELGLDEAFEEGICLIEWPDRLGANFPSQRLDLHLRADGETRIAEIVPSGNWEGRLENV